MLGPREVIQNVLERRERWLGVEDPGRSSGASTNVLCDVDKPLILVEVQCLHLLFEEWAKAVVSKFTSF